MVLDQHPVSHDETGGCVADVPQWFMTEVIRRLSGVKPGNKPGQFYARCPVTRHGDKHQSFAFRPGDRGMTLIYFCQKDCSPEEIRSALAGLGVPEEYLGRYGTPEYESRRQVRATSEERRLLEQARREMAGFRHAIRDLLGEQLTPAMLRIRILALAEGIKVPDERKNFLALAARAGVSQSRRYEAWAQVCTAQGQPVVATKTDHVVLAPPGEDSQVAQRKGHVRFPETGNSLPERENGQTGDLQIAASPAKCPDSRNGKTDEVDMAVQALHAGGITGRKIA